MRLSEGLDLTYCTNIHPAAGLDEVRASLERYAVPLKARLAPDAPFGIGLRLSGTESRELLRGAALAEFRAFLDGHGLYVALINGFPYGPFHGQPVKAQVHAPDWRDDERVAYTLRLAEILVGLLPEGTEGGISTSPLSYGAWIDAGQREVWAQLTANVVRVVEGLVRWRRAAGRTIHLDLEPEPDGLLQRSGDLARFFREWLLEDGARDLAGRLGLGVAQAREAMRDHVQVCFDTCHAAVMYEDPAQALDTYRQAGMKIGRAQLSSALAVPLPADPEARLDVARALAPFAEDTYLHQVVARGPGGGLTPYPDLPAALAHLQDPGVTEWRIHFHVPVFLERAGLFASTQPQLRRTLDLLRDQAFTRHLEIETYTWDVLPPELKLPLRDSIEREYRWVQGEL
ncbi:metabolite traffic protein EboE [Deinococcus petrolearius]|uniref:Metabolite traffic protein EboE n=1 Tax=Deinococcus petrolearius TaxID=1751295 RepID=A0ABW1DGB1_9DEIO